MRIHEGQHLLRGGTPLHTARAAVILLHGRGASAEDILSLGEQAIEDLPCVSLLAPQASGGAWYPLRFLAPLEENEPHLTSALGVVAGLVREVESVGLPSSKIVLAGFSQGACLALEYAARNPRAYGGVLGLSGALIGPPGAPRSPKGGMAGTDVYLGCSDRDPHIPLSSVEEAAAFFRGIGATVDKAIFPGMGHTVNAEELAEFQSLVSAAAATA
jgi:predicted esterase